MKETSIKKSIIYNIIYQILLFLIPVIVTPYVFRVIGVQGIGIYSYTLSIQTFFSLFAALGTISYGKRQISRNRDDIKTRSKLFWEIESLTIITSVFCMLLWLIFMKIANQYETIYLILSLNLLTVMFDISWFYAGLEKFKIIVLSNSIFKIIGMILVFLFIKKPSDLNLYILLTCLTALFSNLTMWLYLRKYIIWVKIEFRNIFRHFNEILIYFIPTIATSIYTVFDKTLIGLISNKSSENGYYEAAIKVIHMLQAITFIPINNVLESRIAYLFKKNKLSEIRDRINKSIDYILLIGVGLSFGIMALANKFIIYYFGTSYKPAILLLQVMSPLIIIIGISNCLGAQYYTPAGLRKKSAVFIIIGSITNLILNLLLIPKFFSLGAAIATIIAELLITILYIKNSNNYITFKNLFKLCYKRIIAGSIMCFVIILLNKFIIYNLVDLLLEVICGILVYLISLIVLKDSIVNKYYDMIISRLRRNKDEY